MEPLRNEKGVALVFVLLLATIGLIVTAGLLHMLARGGYISGQHKRYNTALEAGRGGVEATLRLIGERGENTTGITVDFNPTNFGTKLSTATTSWIGLDSSSTINPLNDNTFDLRFDVGNYRIHAKIVDTVDGNSGADTGLLKTGVVNTGSGEVTVVSVPYLYTVEELAQSTVNPSERAKISVLYQY